MIVRMAKIRILGPKALLAAASRALKDLELVHFAPRSANERLASISEPERTRVDRRRPRLRAALSAVERACARIPGKFSGASSPAPAPSELASWVKLARRVNRELTSLDARRAGAEEELALLEKYRDFVAAFASSLELQSASARTRTHFLIVRAEQTRAIELLQNTLRSILHDAFVLRVRKLPSGESAVVLSIENHGNAQVEKLLAEAGLEEMPLPSSYGATLLEAIPRMRARAAEIPRELEELERSRRTIARRSGAELGRARAAIHELLLDLDAEDAARFTPRMFVIEGWIPSSAFARLEQSLNKDVGPELVIELISEEQWTREDVPVVLKNPALFRPFEAIVRMLPLPRYGTIDPTPFVAIFFPAFFGIIVGDLGYAAVLGAVALFSRLRSKPETRLRSIASIAGACAASSLIFGIFYGELFGDLGRRWFGLEPLLFDREEAIPAFLVLAVALGLVHVLLGLILGAVSAMHGDRHHAIGRSITAVMLLLITVAILAAVEILPHTLLTPTVIALLIAFPALIIAEGVIGAIELFGAIANVLSYARIMAIGTASVMMAVIANRLSGTVGSAIVGVILALLFHAVNFALAVFSPTVHALRLHYVEFFGKFYSPGGVRYEPFGHWHPNEPRLFGR